MVAFGENIPKHTSFLYIVLKIIVIVYPMCRISFYEVFSMDKGCFSEL